MGQLVQGSDGLVVRAENAAELELLAHGGRNGGVIVLDEAYFRVQGDLLLLAPTISAGGAQRICRAFEEAARAHVEAQHRRSQFQVVRSTKRTSR